MVHSKKAVPTEKNEAYAFTKAMEWQRGVKIWHIPNENSIRSVEYLRSMKLQGWNPGISDYFVLINPTVSINGKRIGLFIELKRQKMRLSRKSSRGEAGDMVPTSEVREEQTEFINDVMQIDGIEGHICHGADEAVACVQSFIK
jgi:hypothetical protein